MEVLYTAEATATGGRKNGRAWSSDGAIDVQINPPKEVGGSGEGTNPEQLFAAGYAACFDNALATVARMEKLTPGTTTVTALWSPSPNTQRAATAWRLSSESRSRTWLATRPRTCWRRPTDGVRTPEPQRATSRCG
jgi:Ohr subfamily peroxiredoxin